MFIVLKGAKEKVKEQEELPERPGQTECKVFLNYDFGQCSIQLFSSDVSNSLEFLRFILSLCVYQPFYPKNMFWHKYFSLLLANLFSTLQLSWWTNNCFIIS